MKHKLLYNILPTDVKARYVESGKCVSVKFDGDIRILFNALWLRKKYDLQPQGANIACCNYDASKNATEVLYVFRANYCGIFNNNRRRASKFQKKIQSQIDSLNIQKHQLDLLQQNIK